MDKIRVIGGRKLSGNVTISGAKNAALPLMVASMLTADRLVLENVPDLADIKTMGDLLTTHGCKIDSLEKKNSLNQTLPKELILQADQIDNATAGYDLVSKMRASILVLGPLLARIGSARVSLPGGCAIGTRPIDIHLSGLSQMGAEISLVDGYIEASVPTKLRGANISLPFPSVGATENLMMAAVLASGETRIKNAAREPEVVDLSKCLLKMGANISGIGSDDLIIEGKNILHGARHQVIPDRIEAGTYAMAAAITGGSINIVGADSGHLELPLEMLIRSGVTVSNTQDGINIAATRPIEATDISTNIYPGFPTDLQAQAMALMTIAKGTSAVTESIFENRFMHVPELARLGANISVKGGVAVVRGVGQLKGARLMATDLRASSSLVIAGLAAEGETVIDRVYHIDRGYERIEEKFSKLGAYITRETAS